jgi:dihydrofolate synthase/folylpolyglutamate synthase
LIKVGEEVAWRKNKFNDSGQSFHLKGIRGDYDLTIPLLGEHQLENAAIAVVALEILANLGARVSPESIAKGLSQVCWPGRLQILQHNPLFVVDGAHNADSAMKLREALKQYFDFDNAILIVGTSQEKDIAGIVAELSPLPSMVIVTHSHHPRAVAASELRAEFSKWGIKPQVTENVASAVDLALAKAKPRDLICATGSLFVVAEVIEYIKGLPHEP